MTYTNAPRWLPHPVFSLDGVGHRPDEVYAKYEDTIEDADKAYLQRLIAEDQAPAKAPLVIYHANCMDGMTAAFMAWRGLKGCCILLPWNYSDGLPTEALVTGRVVYTVDFSFGKEHELVQLASLVKDLIMIDHHADACADIMRIIEDRNLLNVSLLFNNNHSGAFLAWEYFVHSAAIAYEDCHVPPIVMYVEDRDLWKFELVNTKAYCMALSSMSKDIATYHKVYNMNVSQLIDIGEAMLAKQARDVRDYASKAIACTAIPGLEVHDGYLCNCPGALVSELGNYLVSQGVSFAVLYEIIESTKQVKVSWRADGLYDCALAARAWGGNGHKNAAGAVLSYDSFNTYRDYLLE